MQVITNLTYKEHEKKSYFRTIIFWKELYNARTLDLLTKTEKIL